MRQLVTEMSTPWWIIAGDADELFPVRYSDELARLCSAPSPMRVHVCGRHVLSLPIASVAKEPHCLRRRLVARTHQQRLGGQLY